MKIIRILIYQGEEDGVKASLSNRWVKDERILGNSSIKEYFAQEATAIQDFDLEKEKQ